MNYKDNTFKLVLISLLPLFLISCDPAQSLEIRNETTDDVELIIVFKDGNSFREAFRQNDTTDFFSDTLVINLDTTAQNSVKVFDFGIGHWKVQNQLDSLAAGIDLIQIKTATSQNDFSNQASILQFLEQQLTGRYDERIEIVIRN